MRTEILGIYGAPNYRNTRKAINKIENNEKPGKRRDMIVNLLSDIKGFNINVPEGAFYVFPDISYFFGKKLKNKLINNSTDFAIFLLEEANVATVTGEAFGNPNCIRISYAASVEKIKTAIERIKEALN